MAQFGAGVTTRHPAGLSRSRQSRTEGHVWIEVTLGHRLLFVDPTHGQYAPPDLLVKAFDLDDRRGYFEYLSRLGYADIGALEGDPAIRCRVSLVKSGLEAGRVPEQWREWERKLNLGGVRWR